jgi:glutamine synthetase
LEKALDHEDADVLKHATHFKDSVIPKMGAVREVADKLETLVDSQYWPLPTYAEMLFIA